MKRKLALLISLLSVLLLAGCSSGEGGGIDLVQLTKNPIVMILIGGIVLWYMLKKSK